MDGARLILNARYFHIAQTGEKATKYAFVVEAAAGLVTTLRRVNPSFITTMSIIRK